MQDRISSISSLPLSGRAGQVHYHLVDSTAGSRPGYAEEIFENRMEADIAAFDRAAWLAGVFGWRVHHIAGEAGFLISSGRADEAGRMIGVQECDDPGCLEVAYGSLC
jgi:hypothetical protein